MAFLKFILTLVLIYFVLRWLYRTFVPEPIRRLISQLRQLQAEQLRAQQAPPDARPAGTVTVEKPQSTRSQNRPRPDAEYTDYEELP